MTSPFLQLGYSLLLLLTLFNYNANLIIANLLLVSEKIYTSLWAALAILLASFLSTKSLRVNNKMLTLINIYIAVALIALILGSHGHDLSQSSYARHIGFAFFWMIGYIFTSSGLLGDGRIFQRTGLVLIAISLFATRAALYHMGESAYYQWVIDSIFSHIGSGQISLASLLSEQTVFRFTWPGMDSTRAVMILNMMVPFAVGGLLCSRSTPWRVVAMVCGIQLTLFVIESYSRGGFMILLLILFAFVYVRLVPGLYAFLMAALLLVAIFVAGDTYLLRLASTLTSVTGQESVMISESSHRLLGIPEALQRLSDAPLFGTDAGEVADFVGIDFLYFAGQDGLLLTVLKYVFLTLPLFGFRNRARALVLAGFHEWAIFYAGYGAYFFSLLIGPTTYAFMLYAGLAYGLTQSHRACPNPTDHPLPQPSIKSIDGAIPATGNVPP